MTNVNTIEDAVRQLESLFEPPNGFWVKGYMISDPSPDNPNDNPNYELISEIIEEKELLISYANSNRVGNIPTVMNLVDRDDRIRKEILPPDTREHIELSAKIENLRVALENAR